MVEAKDVAVIAPSRPVAFLALPSHLAVAVIPLAVASHPKRPNSIWQGPLVSEAILEVAPPAGVTGPLEHAAKARSRATRSASRWAAPTASAWACTAVAPAIVAVTEPTLPVRVPAPGQVTVI